MRWPGILWVGGFLCPLIGCFGPASVTAPTYSAATVAKAALDEFDTNKDGKLEEKELENCPSLLHAFADLDKNADKAIGRDELEERFAEFLAGKVALMTVHCRVMRANQPVGDVDVKFVPEKFHGGVLTTGVGKTEARGSADIRVASNQYPGIAPGFYRVELSQKDAAGNEVIPASHNKNTKVGFQISSRIKGPLRIDIP